MYKVKCYNCYGTKQFVIECKKTKYGEDKNKALTTKKKDWADSLDSDDEVNYALMADAYSDFAYDTDNISELRLFLKQLHISFKNQILEIERIKS